MAETGNNKPLDRWLGLFALAVGIALYMLPKTEPVIILCCILIWFSLVHPFIKFWWVEDRKWRQVSAAVILTIGVVYLGVYIKPEKPQENRTEKQKSELIPAQQSEPTTGLPDSKMIDGSEIKKTGELNSVHIKGATATNPETVVPKNRAPQVKLLFKASPLFTPERRMRIQLEVDAYYHYLNSIGFDIPKEFPPVGIRPGKVSSRSGSYPGTIYSEEIMLPGGYIDDPKRVRAVFSSYIFYKFFVPDPLAESTGFLLTSSIVFFNYYYADFGNIPPPAPRNSAPGDKWISAMWDSREKYGREFANKSLFYTFKQWHVPVENVANEDFDAYFGHRFTIGVGVEDNMLQHAESVEQILRARGIQR